MARRVALFLAAFLVVTGVFLLFPGIDLWASGLFYRPGEGFFLAGWLPFRLVHDRLPYAIVVLGVMLLFAGAVLRRRPILGIDLRTAAFLLISLAVGPGLVVNTVLKDHWGRARPAQIAEFGGDKGFTPVFVPSDQCQRNCSFPAGDPAVAFYFVSFAFLIADRRRRRAAEAAAIGCGAAVGFVRVAQGGHFLSDVVLSGFFVYAASWLLFLSIVRHEGLATLYRHVRSPPVPARRLGLLGAATAVAVVLAVEFIDRPLALFFHASSPMLRSAFAVITNFGEGAGYLGLCAVLFIAFRIAAARAGSPAAARRFAGHAWRAGFVFAAVAVSGLAADLLKPIFGRMRPKLLFEAQLYGFTWEGAHADHWSFPSGHAVTITALATALYLLWPRGLPAYAAAALLVAASRVIIGAHYLGDVLGGAYLALVVTFGLWAVMERVGLGLPGGAVPPRQTLAQP